MPLPPPLALVRPPEWIKGAFIAVPLFLTPVVLSAATVGRVALGIAAFCLIASAGYAFNDILDREADRLHPSKRARPLAAGTMTWRSAAALSGTLLASGLGLAFALSPGFGTVAAAYALLSVAYSLALKNLAILDVAAIAAGFVLRVYAGAVLIGVPPSLWILALSALLALFLALAKRREDLRLGLDARHRRSLARYDRRVVDIAIVALLGGLIVSYLFYTVDGAVMARVGTERLYLTTPLVAVGVARYIQVVLVRRGPGWPIWRILADPAMAAAVGGWLLAFGSFLYG